MRFRWIGFAAVAIVLMAPATGAQAVFRGHKLCDPAIDQFDDAITADAELADLKTKVDESWRQLGSHGDPDMRAATRARRSDWLCEVKTACGADLGAGRACISKRLDARERLNETLLKARE